MLLLSSSPHTLSGAREPSRQGALGSRVSPPRPPREPCLMSGRGEAPRRPRRASPTRGRFAEASSEQSVPRAKLVAENNPPKLQAGSQQSGGGAESAPVQKPQSSRRVRAERPGGQGWGWGGEGLRYLENPAGACVCARCAAPPSASPAPLLAQLRGQEQQAQGRILRGLACSSRGFQQVTRTKPSQEPGRQSPALVKLRPPLRDCFASPQEARGLASIGGKQRLDESGVGPGLPLG